MKRINNVFIFLFIIAILTIIKSMLISLGVSADAEYFFDFMTGYIACHFIES